MDNLIKFSGVLNRDTREIGHLVREDGKLFKQPYYALGSVNEYESYYSVRKSVIYGSIGFLIIFGTIFGFAAYLNLSALHKLSFILLTICASLFYGGFAMAYIGGRSLRKINRDW